MKTKNVLVVDLVFIVGTIFLILAGVYFGFSSKNVSLSPDIEEVYLFKLPSGTLLVDEKPTFDAPERYVVNDQVVVSFKSGIYYLKIDGENYIRKFEVKDNINLIFRELVDGSFAVVNSDEFDFDVEENILGIGRRKFVFVGVDKNDM